MWLIPEEEQRLTRKLIALGREEQRLLDAYQAGVIELPELQERCARIGQERVRLESRLRTIEQQRQSQQQQAALSTTMEEFCRSISDALDNPSFETKQRILRLVVDKVEVLDDQIRIKHMIPIPDVRLRRQPHVVNTRTYDAAPNSLRVRRLSIR
jgi:site-specific DNA recombinase